MVDTPYYSSFFSHGNSYEGDRAGAINKIRADVRKRDLAKQANTPPAAIDDRDIKLPVNQATLGKINYLGSSYSGADIKVIAHLYDVVDIKKKRVQDLEDKMAVATAIISACASLLDMGLQNLVDEASSIFDNTTRQEVFIAACNIGGGIGEGTASGGQANSLDANQVAKTIMLHDVLGSSSFTPIGIIGIRERAQNLRQTYTAYYHEYDQKISDLDRTPPDTSSTVVLGTLQTISVQSFREKNAVRALGHSYAKAYTRGTRCIPATEKVFVDNRGYISIADVLPGDLIQSSDNTFDKVLGSFNQGKKNCYELSLSNGYKIQTSFDHPIYTTDGWIQMQDLKIGQHVLTVGSTPVTQKDFEIPDSILKMIAYLLGDGTTLVYNNEHRIGLSISDQEITTIGQETESILNELNTRFKDYRKGSTKCVDRHINVCLEHKGLTDWHQREYNELHKWLVLLNQYGKKSFEKEIPQIFLSKLSERQISTFLSRLFATDGCYTDSSNHKYVEAKYSSTSENLIDGIRLLLSKLSINAIKSKENKIGKIGGRPGIISKHDCWTLVISDSYELSKFIAKVGIFGKDHRISSLIPLVRSRIRNQKLDINTQDFYKLVKEIIQTKKLDLNYFATKYGIYDYGKDITPRHALSIASELQDVDLLQTVNVLIDSLLSKRNEFIKQTVISVEPVGELQVYDLEVENRHFFICNFIKVHNTIGGSCIFTIFDEHALSELIRSMGTSITYGGERDSDLSTLLPDQLPPIDLTIVFANEYGSISSLRLYGVEFFTDGQVFSIEDLLSEQVMQFVCRDADVMTSHGNILLSRLQRGMNNDNDDKDKTGSSLLFDNQAYYEYLDKLGVRRRLTNR